MFEKKKLKKGKQKKPNRKGRCTRAEESRERKAGKTRNRSKDKRQN